MAHCEDIHGFVASVGIMPTGGGTILVPLFYNSPQNGDITITSAFSVCPGVAYAGGTAKLRLVNLGTSGTVTEAVLWNLGSSGTMTVYDGFVPIKGAAVTPVLGAGKWAGVENGLGTAGTLTLVGFNYLKGVG
jgi:hypothetical protein